MRVRAWLFGMTLASLASAPAFADEAPPVDASGDARADAPADPPADEAPGTEEAVDLTAPVPAPAPAPEETSWLDAPAERRSGFAVGILGGAHLGTARGYPNDALKIDREAFLTDVGFAGGGVGEVYVGIALADWMVFGVGFGYGGTLSADHESRFGALAFRIDAFPAFGAGGAFRDLGLMLEAGLGITNTDVAIEDRPVIESGAASKVAIGIFYEGIRLWKLSMGPYAAADMMFSQSVTQPAAWVGWRTALYVGP